MSRKSFFALFIVVFTTVLSSFAFYFYQVIYTPNILVDQDDRLVAIPSGSSFKDVQNILEKNEYVNDLISFSFLAKLMSYDEQIKPGMYLLKSEMTNKEAITLLRSGNQTPVSITFNNIRTLEELAPRITSNIELKPAELSQIMNDEETYKKYGFDANNFISMFIPNTYKVYWTITAKELLDRMKWEYDRFWDDERESKAERINLSLQEVSTLASIVKAESQKKNERPTIAGLYINRLEGNIPLQADPTLVYATGDFNIRRVLNKHKKIDSPYNTYKNKGLPPGPINMPDINAIDAVLNYEDHNYLYMCAKPDFSGYHVFSSTLREHNIHARRFQQALNKAKVYQ